MTKFKLKLIAAVGAVVTAAPTAYGETLDVARVQPALQEIIRAHYSQLRSLYEHIHQHPELAFQETHTAARLAGEMRALGFDVTERVGKTGVVAMFRNGEGPTVLVRAELDALPMEEKTGLAYASKAKANWNGAEAAVAHSCGHDIHMAVWVGAARALVELKDRWKGTLMFIAQPAEEIDRGAKAMLDDGLFTRFGKPDYALALHVAPFSYGMVGYRAGPTMSASDTVEIVFNGRGGHGAAPDSTIDPVLMAARFIVDVQSVISREKKPAEFGVITIGAVQGGTAGNIIPDTVQLRGTVRSYDAGTHATLIAGLQRTARAVAHMAGADEPSIRISDSLEAVINDAALVAATAPVFAAAFDDNAVLSAPIPASDDFARYGSAGVPSLYFLIGGNAPRQAAAEKALNRTPPSNHSPQFAPVPEPTIKTGVQAMTLAVLNLMSR